MNIIDMLNEAWNAGFDAAFHGSRSRITREFVTHQRPVDIHRIFAQHAAADMLVEIIENWQPIETAPKDYTRFLASDGEKMLVAHWSGGDWLSDEEELWFPTHWMPLPEAPQ